MDVLPGSLLINRIMKKINVLLAVCAIFILAACKEENEKPKVIYENSNKAKPASAKSDPAQIEIADLPIQITGTDVLIHPVGDLRVNDKGQYSSGGSDVSFTISNYNEFEITGYLRNLKFQKTDSDSINVLTKKPVLIQTATYLKSVSDKLKKQYLVYTLADMDTNKDGQLDGGDIKSLYISTIHGKEFQKLSADFEELIDWKLVEGVNRLYFRTMEDTNKNGEFDKKDVLHYNMLDFTTKEWKVSAYNPM